MIILSFGGGEGLGVLRSGENCQFILYCNKCYIKYLMSWSPNGEQNILNFFNVLNN